MVHRRTFVAVVSASAASAVAAVIGGQSTGQGLARSWEPASLPLRPTDDGVPTSSRAPMRVSALPIPTTTIAVPARTLPAVTMIAFASVETVRVTHPRGFRVSVQFDGRVFEPMDRVIISLSGDHSVVGTSVTNDIPPLPSSVSYDLPDAFGTEEEAEVVVPIPLTVRQSYPADGVDAPLPVTLTIVDADGRELATSRWPVRTTPVSVWGGEVAAAWSATDVSVITASGAVAGAYRYPAIITCRSVGPASIPAGSTITVVVDDALLEQHQVRGVREHAESAATAGRGDWPASAYSVRYSVDGRDRRAVILLKQEIPPGTAIEVRLEAIPRPTPTLGTTVRAVATLAGPDSPDHFPRRTGRYTAADVTSGGAPLSPRVVAGKI